MKNIFLSILLVGMYTITTQSALAALVNPSSSFTLRSTSEGGPALDIDSNWSDGGFQGLLTSEEGFIVDHTQFEFDMSEISGPVVSASLEWTIAGVASDTLFVDSYMADGLAAITDWIPGQIGGVGTSTAANGFHSLDITALVNSSLAIPYLGFSFSIDPFPTQAIFLNQNSAQINFTLASVPEPVTLALISLGLIGLGVSRNKKKTQ